MFKLLVINAHWYNRGDEAALRAMLDELVLAYPDIQIDVSLLAGGEYFKSSKNIRLINGRFPAGRRIRWLDGLIRYISYGKLGIKKESKCFIDAIKNADLIIHGPGGPSIGDIYQKTEIEYLIRFLLIQRLKKPYVFYAPSMGPFRSGKNDAIRRRVLERAKFIAVREPVSAGYLKEFGIKNSVYVTMDSAFQCPVDEVKYGAMFMKDISLQKFLLNYEKVIGLTITDLIWNPKYCGRIDLKEKIRNTFSSFIEYLTNRGYGIIFIPQLFAKEDDYSYMAAFLNDNCFIIPDKEEYDCYFQQYVISKLYAVIGMRYHSNIFAAKMGTPFVSVAYEQKMSGFMEEAGLNEYCIPIEQLSDTTLNLYFDRLCTNYTGYKKHLNSERYKWAIRAHRTTELICDVLHHN